MSVFLLCDKSHISHISYVAASTQHLLADVLEKLKSGISEVSSFFVCLFLASDLSDCSYWMKCCRVYLYNVVTCEHNLYISIMAFKHGWSAGVFDWSHQ